MVIQIRQDGFPLFVQCSDAQYTIKTINGVFYSGICIQTDCSVRHRIGGSRADAQNQCSCCSDGTEPLQGRSALLRNRMNLDLLADRIVRVRNLDNIAVFIQSGCFFSFQVNNDGVHEMSSFHTNFRYSAICG